MDFEEHIKVDDSFWTVVDGKILQVNAEKNGNIKGWWTRAFKGEPELCSSKLQPEVRRQGNQSHYCVLAR